MKNREMTIIEEVYNSALSIDENRNLLYDTINNLIYIKYRHHFEGKIYKLNPLDIEIAMDNKKRVLNLIENGYDINSFNDRGITPLMIAIYLRKYEICKLLIENGADVNAIYEHYQFTPLIFACNAKDDQIIELLLQNGANINIKDKNGYDALHHLINNGTINNLISNYSLKFTELFYPFGVVCSSKFVKEQVMRSIDLLIEYGLDIDYINKENKEYVNALSIALESFRTDDYITKKLVENGALRNAFEINPGLIYGYQDDLKFIKEDLKARDLSGIPSMIFGYIVYLKYLNRIKKNNITVYYQENDNIYKRPKVLKKKSTNE